MTALVSRFALLGRSAPSAEYEALRRTSQTVKGESPAKRRRASGRWTGSSEIVERPARYAA